MLWQAWYAEMMRRIEECVLPKSIRDRLRCDIIAMLRNRRRDYLISSIEVDKKRRARLKADVKKHEQEFEEFMKVEENGPV